MAQNMQSADELAARELVISRLLNAPRELVFEVWTHPDHIAHWWGPMGFTNTIAKMEVRPDGVWEFVMHGPDGKNYKNKSIFTEIVPPERLAFRHVSGHVFDVVVTFDEQPGGQTLLTWRMIFETSKELQRVIREVGADVGLHQNVDRLEAYLVDHDSRPFVIQRTFDARAEQVWQALTDPEQMRQWYFDLPAFRAEPGCEFQFYGGPPEKQYLHLCRVTEVVPVQRLAYTWRYDGYDGNSLVTFELFDEGEKTRLQLTHSGLNTFGHDHLDLAKKNFAGGWLHIVGTALPKFLATQQ